MHTTLYEIRSQTNIYDIFLLYRISSTSTYTKEEDQETNEFEMTEAANETGMADYLQTTEHKEEEKNTEEQAWSREEDGILLQRIKEGFYTVDAELSNQFMNRNEAQIQNRLDYVIHFLTHKYVPSQ